METMQPELVSALVSASIGLLMVYAGMGKKRLARRSGADRRRRRRWWWQA
jgi:hypothetical protein